MSIASEVNRINSAKADSFAAVKEKGGSVPPGSKIADLPGAIRAIPMDFIPTAEKGKAGGVASLGGDGKVPSAQLPDIGGDKPSFSVTVGTTWVEDPVTGAKSQEVNVPGMLEKYNVSFDVPEPATEDKPGYDKFVEEQNQTRDYLTNGYAKTYDGRVKFVVFKEANTIPIHGVLTVVSVKGA